MFDFDKWQEIIATISKHKLRTALTMLGVSWGILLLIIMLGAGNGLRNGAMSEIGNMASNSLFIWSSRTTVPHEGLQAGRFIRFYNDDIAAVREEVEEIEYFAPRLQLGGGENMVRNGTKTGDLSVRGETPDFLKIDPIEVKEGRFINQLDIKDKRKVAVLGERAQELLFDKEEDPIGQYIQVKGTFFRVVGVFKSGSRNRGQDQDQTIIIPLTTLQQSFNMPNRIGWMVCTIDPKYQVSEIEQKIKDVLKSRHKVAPNDDLAIGSFNLQKEFDQIKGLFTGINMFVWFVGVCTLIAGILGVSNIMLIVVKERTKEIGVRRAIGAPPMSILSLIIQESVFLTAIAGYIGLILGIVFLNGIDLLIGAGEGSMFKHPEVNMQTVLIALFILIIGGAIAGLLPAYQALQIKPVEALKSE